MATYSSYKKLLTDNLADGAISSTKLQWNARPKPTTLWVYNPRAFACGGQCSNDGGCTYQADGYCCLWTVPTGVTRVVFEIWSGGGGGAGMICCNYCSFAIGGGGGNYGMRSISTTPGCQYTICAGGSWPCSKGHTCSAGMGCRSYVNGFNLSNFCTMGGCGGWMCDGDAWGPRHHQSGCANCNICGIFGADFGMMGSIGFKMGHMGCHCSGADGQWSGAAPMIGMMHSVSATESWCSCGCYVNWPSGGGISGASSYCDNWAKNCAGGSGQGGSGIVKVTYA